MLRLKLAMATSGLVCARSFFVRASPLAAAATRRHTSSNLKVAQAQAPRSRCYGAAVLSREDRNMLRNMSVYPENKEVVTRVLEQARRAAGRWEVVHSDFLSPPALSDGIMALRGTADVGFVVSGGYAEAERCRVSLGNLEGMTPAVQAEIASTSVAAVSIAGNFKFDSAAHGDFLGAVLNSGIVREKVGDIIVTGDEGAHVLVVPELVGFLCAAVTQVRGVSVETSPIALADLAVRTVKKDVFKTIEASLRVDALASAGFRMSRSKLSESISGGALSVNWKVVTKSGAILKSGDVVSLRGKGRIQVGEISTTKKGRYAVELARFC